MLAALLFLLPLLNDRGVMGEHVNRLSQNIAAYCIVGLLVVLNGVFGLTIVFPHWL